MAEQVLEKESGAIPVAIVRPSIVAAALKEPIPGWIDSLNGMTGWFSLKKKKTRLIIPDSFPSWLNRYRGGFRERRVACHESLSWPDLGHHSSGLPH